jgi:uncharacterized protein (DUF1501 family)
MKRRSFLKSAAATAALSPIVVGGLPLRANTSLSMLAQLPAPEDDRVLLMIQLFGGNDGLNTMIPALDDEYYKIRPSIAVPKDQAWNKIGDIFLHPALAWGDQGGMARMLELGTLAIVQGVGYDNPDLSHFRSTDIWLSGLNISDPGVRLDTGWIGRYLEQRYPDFPQSLPEHPLAVQFGGFSLALLGSKGRMGIEVEDPSLQAGVTSQLDTLDPQSKGTNYEFEYGFVADIANRSNKYAQAVKAAYAAGKPQLRGDYGDNGFARQIASVAALMAGGLKTKVYVVGLGGFDTHVMQQIPGNLGTHPSLLGTISVAVAELMHDLTRLGQADRLVGMTVSEFGRRPFENGSRGTDHGAASVQFVFGTQVNSGVFGNAPDLKNLNANGDLYYQVDYRKVYAEILTDWFGLSLQQMREVLRDDTLTPVDVLKSQQPSSVREGKGATGSLAIAGSYPNPFASSMTVEITIDRPCNALVELTTPDGRRVATLADRRFEAGSYRLPFSGDLPSGTYLCTLRTGEQRVARAVRCVR